MKYSIYILFIIESLLSCTIGVRWDLYGRPVIWKNRDKSICCTDCDTTIIDYEKRSNRLYFRNNNDHYDHLSISTGGFSNPYMGMNNQGFAIVNSYVDYDLDRIWDENNRSIENNSDLIREALMSCSTITDFINLLDSLDIIMDPNKGISSNFAVIDSNRQAGIFEVYVDSDTVAWDSVLLSGSVNYIIRTNLFHLLEEYNPPDTGSSIIRYNKAVDIMNNINLFKYSDLFNLDNFIDNTTSNLPFLRNFSRSSGSDYEIPYPKQTYYNRPYGYFKTNKSINRSRTVSSVIIKGINSDLGEDISETVMWANVGNPTTSVYFPFNIVDVSSDGVPELLSGNDSLKMSEFSILTNKIREELFDYDSDCAFNRYIDSYLLIDSIGIFEKLNQIEVDFINNYSSIDVAQRVTDTFDMLQEYYDNLINDFQNTNCEIGNQVFSGTHKLIDSSKHFPRSCYWTIFDNQNQILYDDSTCFNPEINYPILSNFIKVDHSIVDEFGNLFECDIIEFIFGDLNSDDEVNILDIIIIVNIILGEINTANFQYWLGDVNQDGVIDISDIIQLINIILYN